MPGPRHRPQAHHVGVIAETVATDGQADFTFAVVKTPMVVDPAAEHVQQAIVLGQLFELARFAVPGQIRRGGTQHATVMRGDGQGDQA